MTKEEIMNEIQEYVKADIYGDLYGHEDAAEYIASRFIQMKNKMEQLEKRVSDMGWELNPDRSSGQFTQEEIAESERGGPPTVDYTI